jgi:anaerobic ribonucleoside-triphosphate reductase activating protein
MNTHSASTLRIHRFLSLTHAEGPGARACIWVQGCPIKCEGCGVPWTWATEGGEVIDVQDIVDRILSGPEVEGITFLGGEPFAQAGALAKLGGTLRRAGLSVLTFTGYLYEHLISENQTDWNSLLRVTDLLIDGPYKQHLRDLGRPWVGSSNQRYHFLTERYRQLETKLLQLPNRVELRIHLDGEVRINGMLAGESLKVLAQSMLHAPRQAIGFK